MVRGGGGVVGWRFLRWLPLAGGAGLRTLQVWWELKLFPSEPMNISHGVPSELSV